MKKLSKIFTMVTLVLLTFISCKKDDNSNNGDNQTSAQQTTQIAQTGTWRITSFIDSGTDETSDFNGYTFTFNADGTLVAVKTNNTVSGTWSVSDDNSNSSNDDDNNSTEDDEFLIFFNVGVNSEFEDLNDDWDVVSISSSVIELIDISGGNGGTDLLTFKRN